MIVRIHIDYQGTTIVLSAESAYHILDTHNDMTAHIGKIGETLAAPTKVTQSRTVDDTKLYYRLYDTPDMTGKYCVS